MHPKPVDDRLTRCYKCQKYGHFGETCSRRPACGYCAENHATHTCNDKNNVKCVNCGQAHPAFYLKCTRRKEILAQVYNKQPTRTVIPAHDPTTESAQSEAPVRTVSNTIATAHRQYSDVARGAQPATKIATTTRSTTTQAKTQSGSSAHSQPAQAQPQPGTSDSGRLAEMQAQLDSLNAKLEHLVQENQALKRQLQNAPTARMTSGPAYRTHPKTPVRGKQPQHNRQNVQPNRTGATQSNRNACTNNGVGRTGNAVNKAGRGNRGNRGNHINCNAGRQNTNTAHIPGLMDNSIQPTDNFLAQRRRQQASETVITDNTAANTAPASAHGHADIMSMLFSTVNFFMSQWANANTTATARS